MTPTEQRLFDRFKADRLSTEQLVEALHPLYKNATSLLEAIRRDTCPVKTYLVGKRRTADISDVAAYLDEQKAHAA